MEPGGSSVFRGLFVGPYHNISVYYEVNSVLVTNTSIVILVIPDRVLAVQTIGRSWHALINQLIVFNKNSVIENHIKLQMTKTRRN